MKQQWMVALPRQGQWFHVDDIVQADDICEEAKKYSTTHEIKLIALWAGGSAQWILDAIQKIEALKWQLRNKTGCNLRIRMKVKQK